MENKKGLLSQQFLSKYSDFPQHMSELGKFVYYRTYSRWLEDKQRRETWKETVKRAVEYNCSLVPDVPQREAEKLFDNMFNLRQFCSGRTLWVGGTEASKRFPASNFNCSFVVIDDFEAIYDLFYLLMVGTGVGFRILKSDVEKLPRMRDDIELIVDHYNHDPEKREVTSTLNLGEDLFIFVGDSKEGWGSAMLEFLKVFYHNSYRNIKRVIINLDYVRPKGERLKTFGGLASGPEPLAKMFKKVYEVLTSDKFSPKPVNGKLRPIHLLDICNIIAEGIVVGGVN